MAASPFVEHDMTQTSAGARFRAAVADEAPLQVMGAITAYAGLMAKRTGYQGALPVRRRRRRRFARPARPGHQHAGRRARSTCAASPTRAQLPLLVDIDTGFGAARSTSRARSAIADQGRRRRHAHRRPGRREALRPPPRQGGRVARTRWSTASRPRSMRAPMRTFVIMARTDAARGRRPRCGDRARAAPASRPAPT